MTLWAIIGSVVSTALAIVGAVIWGGRNAKHKRDAQEARRSAATYRNSKEAQDEASDLSDRAVSDRLRQRAKR